MDADRHLLANLVLARGEVDRLAERRADAPWQAERRRDPRSRVIRVCDGAALVRTQQEAAVELDLVPAPSVPETADLTFLGVDTADVAYFAEHVGSRDDLAEIDGTSWSDLRMVGAALDSRDAGLMVTAVALDNWLRTHARCPRCGAVTEFNAAGWSRRCPEDGSEHFPRTDPAVIVLVRDRDDRALLGRQGRWAPGWFSTLAGFVESGESAEAALRREIHEEAGVVIADGPDDIRYLGSQPWPFPCSLMLGYHAWTDDPAIDVDGDEITEARWFTRDELAAACASGDVRLPPPVSIARRLVERWYGAELPGTWSRA
ncbi:MAG: diphosphatase [Actinomycetota bacterium]|nr:diphosphatase [Actinomycetota bacterium]